MQCNRPDCGTTAVRFFYIEAQRFRNTDLNIKKKAYMPINYLYLVPLFGFLTIKYSLKQ